MRREKGETPQPLLGEEVGRLVVVVVRRVVRRVVLLVVVVGEGVVPPPPLTRSALQQRVKSVRSNPQGSLIACRR